MGWRRGRASARLCSVKADWEHNKLAEMLILAMGTHALGQQGHRKALFEICEIGQLKLLWVRGVGTVGRAMRCCAVLCASCRAVAICWAAAVDPLSSSQENASH